MVYRAGWPFNTPADIDRCYLWQIAALLPPDPEPEQLLDPDGQAITPEPISEERLERWRRFEARRGGDPVD